MRILILGGDGMLGHQLLKSYSGHHDVRVTLRQPLEAYTAYGLFHVGNSFAGTNVLDFNRVSEVIQTFRPEAVINAVGIVKQRAESHDAILSLEINSLLPHKLALLCGDIGARFVHMSTDCVFSGATGMYNEEDTPDATDLYGRSKLLGEVSVPHAITLRTSIIGLELSRKRSLIEWFLQQIGVIQGFKNVIYSGFTTIEMARIIELILTQQMTLSGVWHVASKPINKYDLLHMLLKKLPHHQVEIVADDKVKIDRSLDGFRFEKMTGYSPPSWNEQLDELAAQIKERKNDI